MLIEIGIGVVLAAGLVVFALRRVQSVFLAERLTTQVDSIRAPRD